MDSTGGAERTKRKRQAYKYTGEDQSKKDSAGYYTHNKRGLEVCKEWNQGRCGKPTPQSKCKATPPKSHQCSKCLGPHQAKDCKQR